MSEPIPGQRHVPTPRDVVVLRVSATRFRWICQRCPTAGTTFARRIAVAEFKEHRKERHP